MDIDSQVLAQALSDVHYCGLPPTSVFVMGCYFSIQNTQFADLLQFLKQVNVWLNLGQLTEAQQMFIEMRVVKKGIRSATDLAEKLRLKQSLNSLVESQNPLEEEEKRPADPMTKPIQEIEVQAPVEDKSPESLVVCDICYDMIQEADYLPLEKCGHMFHPACIKDFLEYQITERKFPLKCPNPNCGTDIVDLDLRERLTEELYQKCEEYRFKLYVEQNQKELVSCPTPDCPFVFEWEPGNPNFQCPSCNRQWCLKCRQEVHNGLTCAERLQLTNPQDLDRMFQVLAQQENMKQCPQCQMWVEKEDGCDFIKCKCGFPFCYKCGTGFKDCKCGVGFCETCQADMVHCRCRNRNIFRAGRLPQNLFGPGLGFPPPFPRLPRNNPAVGFGRFDGQLPPQIRPFGPPQLGVYPMNPQIGRNPPFPFPHNPPPQAQFPVPNVGFPGPNVQFPGQIRVQPGPFRANPMGQFPPPQGQRPHTLPMRQMPQPYQWPAQY